MENLGLDGWLTQGDPEPSLSMRALEVAVAFFAFVTRGKEYGVLDHPLVQARLHLPPDQFQQRPESQMVRSLYDCPQVPVRSLSVPCRLVVATHPVGKKKSPVGVTRAGVVYELFLTNLPQQGFTACDVVELYLHRGAFEPALSDEQGVAVHEKRAHLICNVLSEPLGGAAVVLHDACARREVLRLSDNGCRFSSSRTPYLVRRGFSTL